MKIKCLIDRKGPPIMRPRENYVGSMQIAFQNILNEIMEHVIEGICFDVHRAVKLDYYPVNEYILNEHKFEIQKQNETSCPAEDNDKADDESDDDDLPIYGIGNPSKTPDLFSTCDFCGQAKSARALARHEKICKRTNGSSSQDNGKSENFENNVKDEDNIDGKKGNDAKKQAKSTIDYDTASPEEIHEFLMKHCGVISKHSKKPCSNSSNCYVHSKEDKESIRSFIFGNYAAKLGGDIDIDTVD